VGWVLACAASGRGGGWTWLGQRSAVEGASSAGIWFGGETQERVGRQNMLGSVFERAALLRACTALQNGQMTLDITGVDTPLTPAGLLDEFGLGAFKDHYPHQLSGGMQQRVNIAAAMVHNPPFLMMDEPFGALDEMTREFMCEFLGEVLLDNPKTTVLVTHSIDEAVMLADRVVILAPRPGRISAIVDVGFPRPRRRDLKTQSAFAEKVLEVRRLLYEVDGP